MNRFETLKDIIPNPLGIDEYFLETHFSEDFCDLINDITDGNIKEFFLQYYGKSRNKRLNSFIDINIENYGTKKVGFSDVIDSQFNDILADEIPVIVSIESEQRTLMDISINSICKLIENRYKLKWSKLYDTLGFEYNPIKPFSLDVNEQVSDNLTSSSMTTNNNDSETMQDYTTEKRYGYQAGQDSPTPTDKSESKYKDEGSSTSENHYTRSNPRARQTNRNGNIGNIPQQELIKRERELWEYQIYDVMFKDLDKVLVIATYGKCG